MLMDKKFRLLGKISIIDIFAALVLVGAIVFAFNFSAPTVAANPGDVKIRYTVELPKKTPEFYAHIKSGEKLYDILKGYEIGTIVDFYKEPYMEEIADYSANIFRHVEIPGYETIHLIIEANAQITTEATAIGQYEVMVGKDVYVKTKDFASGGFVIRLERQGTADAN